MYFVTRVNFNQQGQQSNSVQMYTDLTAAQKRYYSILATDVDNGNLQYELCQVVGEDGIVLMTQVFNNRPVPTPTTV